MIAESYAIPINGNVKKISVSTFVEYSAVKLFHKTIVATCEPTTKRSDNSGNGQAVNLNSSIDGNFKMAPNYFTILTK